MVTAQSAQLQLQSLCPVVLMGVRPAPMCERERAVMIVMQDMLLRNLQPIQTLCRPDQFGIHSPFTTLHLFCTRRQTDAEFTLRTPKNNKSSRRAHFLFFLSLFFEWIWLESLQKLVGAKSSNCFTWHCRFTRDTSSLRLLGLRKKELLLLFFFFFYIFM